jgi:recombination protein RecA
MSSDKKQKLAETMAELQDRWGSSAVRRLGQIQRGSVPHVPTGFPALDKALAIGGLPSGRITEIVGSPTSGVVTLALTLVARAQLLSGSAIYIDLGQNFDPQFAAHCGLDLSNLVLIRPKDTFQALSILHDFVSGGVDGVLVFDADLARFGEPQQAKALATTLDRIISPLSQSTCLLLFLTSLSTTGQDESGFVKNGHPNGSIIPHHSAVRLKVRREKWVYKDGDIAGYKVQVNVTKNKLGPAGNQVNLTIQFIERSSFEAVTTTCVEIVPARTASAGALSYGGSS